MNETLSNESVNAASNNSTGFWMPLDGVELPDMDGKLDSLILTVQETLVSWGYDPFKIVFIACIVLGSLLLIYHLFVKGTSKASDIFKPILYLAALVLLLVLLGVI